MYPSVIKVLPRDDYKILVEFDNNECGILNMEPYLNFGVFNKIKDPNLFAKVRVSFDTIEWKNGIDDCQISLPTANLVYRDFRAGDVATRLQTSAKGKSCWAITQATVSMKV